MLGYSLRLYLYSLPASVLLLWGEVGVFYILELLEATCLASSRRLRMMSVTCILAVCSALLLSGVYILENTGMMGKKYHEINARADKKGEKERKDKGKEKISDKMTEQEQCFIKLWETWKKMQAIGDIISYFFPYYFNCRAKKSTKIRLGENI